MSKCHFCGQEMLEAEGCLPYHYMIRGRRFEPIKVGDPGDFYEGEGEDVICGDCGAHFGQYHHLRCDLVPRPAMDGEFPLCACEFDIVEND